MNIFLPVFTLCVLQIVFAYSAPPDQYEYKNVEKYEDKCPEEPVDFPKCNRKYEENKDVFEECQRTCLNMREWSEEYCENKGKVKTPGCDCKKGYVRKVIDGDCVKETECSKVIRETAMTRREKILRMLNRIYKKGIRTSQ